MAKCVRLQSNRIVREPDHVAAVFVQHGSTYVPKSEYKRQQRLEAQGFQPETLPAPVRRRGAVKGVR